MNATALIQRPEVEWSRLHVLLELRHTRLRLEIIANEIDYAKDLLSRGQVTPQGAITILNDAVDIWWGG